MHYPTDRIIHTSFCYTSRGALAETRREVGQKCIITDITRPVNAICVGCWRCYLRHRGLGEGWESRNSLTQPGNVLETGTIETYLAGQSTGQLHQSRKHTVWVT